MGTSSKLILVVAIFATTISSTCKKKLICADANSYSFQIGISAYPDKDSIHVSDTLWLECNSPSNLKDLLSGDMIDYSGVKNLGTVLTLLQFQNATNVQGAIRNFSINVIKGTQFNSSSDPTSNQEYLITEENKIFKLKLAIIPKDTGRFVLTISNASGIHRTNDVCTKAAFEIDFQNTNQHFYLLQLWRPDLYLTLDALGKPKVYYFKVY